MIVPSRSVAQAFLYVCMIFGLAGFGAQEAAVVQQSSDRSGLAFMRELRDRDAELAQQDAWRAAMGSTGKAAISGVSATPMDPRVHERVELRVDCSGSWINPFDPRDVKLSAEITTPSGRTFTVPGFYKTGYYRTLVDGREVLRRNGDDGWRVRFVPVEPGVHRVVVTIDDGDATADSRPMRIEAGDEARRGFVRRSERQPRYLTADDELFFPLGLNHAWVREAGTYEFDRTFASLAKVGGNTVRTWLCPTFHSMSLETAIDQNDWGLPGGLGWMNQKAAWRFDHAVETADEIGIRLVPVAFSFSGWRGSAEPKNWSESPYNAANGGPLEKPGDMFSDPATRELNKRRLRYIVARWCYSPAVLLWELWNEVSGVDGYDARACAAWHKEMARLVQSLDPYDRIVATSTWWTEGEEELMELDELGLLFTHEYNALDHGLVHYETSRDKLAVYDKPHLVGEFGNQEFDYGDTGAYGPERVALHNALWAGLTSGSAGGALYWYWEIGEKDGWHRLIEPLAGFLRGLPLHERSFEPVSPQIIGYADEALDAPPPPVVLGGGARSWEDTHVNEPRTFALDRHGHTEDPHLVPAVLHAREPLLNTPTFLTNYARDGSFSVRVKGVSGWGGASLRVTVDGEDVLNERFDDPSESSTAQIDQYNGAYTVPVEMGRREIRVENTGPDWAIVSFAFDGVTTNESVPLWVTGMRADDPQPGDIAAVLWARHDHYNWGSARESLVWETVPPAKINVPEIPSGTYDIEWIDTHSGLVIQRTKVTSDGEGLVLSTPSISKSVAAKLRLR